jgi:RNA polymerase sigma-70 factor, ECF subfamily
MSRSDDAEEKQRAERRRRAREGDTYARFELLDEHRGAIYRRAYRMLGNAADAEDAVEETLLCAVEHYTQYDEGRALEAWVSGIARHVCLRMLGRRAATVSLAGAWEIAAPGSQTPEAALRAAEAERQFRCAIGKLTRPLREVAWARLYLGLGQAEIAERLGIAERTAQMRWTRARQLLRKLMPNWEE